MGAYGTIFGARFRVVSSSKSLFTKSIIAGFSYGVEKPQKWLFEPVFVML